MKLGGSMKAAPVALAWRPNLPIYASEAFLKNVGNQFGWIAGSDRSGVQRCVLPYVIHSKPGFRMIRFRSATIPWTGEIGVEEERSFLNGVVEYFRSAGADLILPSGNSAVFRTYPDGASVASYGTVVKDLDRPEDVLWREIRKTYRQNIRKAQESGVQITCGMNYLNESYALVADTMKRSGGSFLSYEAFERRVLDLGDNVKIFVALFSGQVQGCMVAPFSQHCAYNCYAGSQRNPALGAMHLLHWEAMRAFRSMGVKQFDFQGMRMNPEKGSKQEGIATYKRGFGGRVVQGYSWRYPLHALKFAAYVLAARLLSGGDLIDQERHTSASS
jgi:hypothetical protein